MGDVDLTPPPSAWPESKEPDSLIGVELGNFRIVERIAEGGMGVIYRAGHTVIGRQAAIKVLTRKYSSDRNMIKRLHREAQAVNRIGHPNIVDIFDFGRTDDGREYFVMEYLPGKSLAQLLERRSSLPWATTEQIIRQLLDALAAAHHHGIIHRDIKPENILIVPQDDGKLLTKVLDFGIAKSVGLGPIGEQLTRAGSVMGTPEYIAPEQIRGKKIDGRADLYAIGVILFELVMGRRPFVSDKVITLLMAHLREPIPPLEIAPELEVPSHVPDVIRKAMAKKPEQRFADAHAFGRALGFELEQVSPTAGTRPLPDFDPDAFEEDVRSTQSPTAAPARIPQATRPGAGVLTTDVPRGTATRRWSRWAPPLVILAIALGAIGVKVTRRFATKSGNTTTTDATPADKDAGIRKTAFSPIGDIDALLMKLRRQLRKNAQATDPRYRRSALRALGRLRDNDVRPLLVNALNVDPDPSVRAAAALALADLGDAATVLRKARPQNGALAQVSIDEALMRLGKQDGRSGLSAALASKDNKVRISAALALGEAGDRRALPVLLEAIGQIEAIEQQAIVAVMGIAAKLGHVKAHRSLAQGLQRDDKPLIQLGCAEALAKLGSEKALATLGALLQSANMATRLIAARVLASFGDYAGLETLVEGIRAKQHKTRALAATGLGAVADKTALSPLNVALDDNKQPVRIAAADSLARIFALMPDRLVRQSQNWVFAALERGNWSMRHAAVGVTSEMDPELAVELLGWALLKGDERVRAAAVARLGKMRSKSPRAIKILKVALTDESPDVRAHAAQGLGTVARQKSEYGGSAEEALEMLGNAVRDPDSRVGIIAAGQMLAAGKTRHLHALKTASRFHNPRLRAQAITELGKWKKKAVVKLLLGGLKDRAAEVRLAAAVQLARRGNNRGLKELNKAVRRGSADAHLALRAMAKLGVSQAAQLKKLALSKDASNRISAMEVSDLLKPADALVVLRIGSRDRRVGVRRAAAQAIARNADKHPGMLGVLRQLAHDSDPAVRAAAGVGLSKLRRGYLDHAPPQSPIKPAPLKEDRKQPQRPPAKDGKEVTFVDDVKQVDRYKYHISRADALAGRRRYKAALRHLRLARRSMNKAPVLFDMGFVHFKMAEETARKSPRLARKHLKTAQKFYKKYLSRAPKGKLAVRARGGLSDIKWLAGNLGKRRRRR